LEDRFDHFAGREMGGIEVDSVGGLEERGFGAGTVAMIAGLDFPGYGGKIPAELVDAAGGADIGGGVEEDFHLGVREYVGGDIASFHDDTETGSHGALFFDEGPPDPGYDRDLGGGARDFGGPDGGRNVFAIQKDLVRAEFDIGGEGQLGEIQVVIERGSLPKGPEGDGSVHRAGVDVEKAHAFGDLAGNRAFAGTGWTINGHDDSFFHALNLYFDRGEGPLLGDSQSLRLPGPR